jgi:hypothetical protein
MKLKKKKSEKGTQVETRTDWGGSGRDTLQNEVPMRNSKGKADKKILKNMVTYVWVEVVGVSSM